MVEVEASTDIVTTYLYESQCFHFFVLLRRGINERGDGNSLKMEQFGKCQALSFFAYGETSQIPCLGFACELRY